MTFQHKDMGGFRQLESSELERVSGGCFYDFPVLNDFQALDVNSDGALSQAEIAASDWTSDDFSDADSDGDGVLSEVEMAILPIVVTALTPEQQTAGLNNASACLAANSFLYADGLVQTYDPYTFQLDLNGAPLPIDAGAFYAGFFAASGLGAQVGGGGGESSSAMVVGVGTGFEIGFSQDSSVAAANGEINSFSIPGLISVNGIPVAFHPASPISNVDLGFNPFTFGITAGIGGFISTSLGNNTNTQ